MSESNWHIDARAGLTLTGTRRAIDELRALAHQAGVPASWGDSSAPGGFFVRFDMGARGSSLSPDAPPEGGGPDRPAPAGSGRCPECGRLNRVPGLQRHAHWCSRSGLAQKPADIGTGVFVLTDLDGRRYRSSNYTVNPDGSVFMSGLGRWTAAGYRSVVDEGYPPVP